MPTASSPSLKSLSGRAIPPLAMGGLARHGALRRRSGALSGALSRTRSGARIGALAWAILGVSVVAGVMAAPRASAAETAPEVRVLLYRGPGPVRVAGARLTAETGGERMLRDGRPAGRRLAWPGPVKVEGTGYCGRVVATALDGELRVVNEVSVERYVEGTLLREVYPGWGAAVLRAQAVVARTYALHRRRRARARGAGWDVTAGAESQVYGGMAAEAPAARDAVAATRGQVLLWRGEPILAAYHSASGGRTASAEEVWGRPVPYLVSVPVDGEEISPKTYWRIPVSAATLGQALGGQGRPVGPVVEVRVLERSPSGRVRRALLRGAGGAAELDGRELRRLAGGLPSTRFEVRAGAGEAEKEFLFVGTGYGHGVGMSQWGAHAMARQGARYREILERFYPGTELRSGWGAGEGG